MATWREIMGMAEDAGNMLITDRARGEQAFERLLMTCPRDGMVFFQRAKAFEAIGEFKLAEADYGAAERLFPKESWRTSAREGSSRMARKLATGGTIAEARRRIEGFGKVDSRLRQDVLVALDKANGEPSSTAAELRRCLEMLTDQLLAQHGLTSTGDLDGNIRALRDHVFVPELVSNHMHTIRILGNRALHPKGGEQPLQSSDVYPSLTAMAAVLEWLNANEPQGTG